MPKYLYPLVGLGIGLVILVNAGKLHAQNALHIEGIRFYLNEHPFPYTGISFFNAIYNDTFNQSSEERGKWLQKFKNYGINTLRIWAQWDSERGFVDSCPECSLYDEKGNLRENYVHRLRQILTDCDNLDMVVELALFSHESIKRYEVMGKEAANSAVLQLIEVLRSHRNLAFQIWNEHSDRVLDFYRIIKKSDPERLVTNSPGFAGNLGDTRQNETMDFLTPHTSRQNVKRNWEVAPGEIAYLLNRFKKPVVDDEPARNGTSNFGGPKEPTFPFDQVSQILAVWQVGGYVNYHHDMFQLGAGGASTPPSGIPDPEFNPYHLQVFKLLALKDRYMPE